MAARLIIWMVLLRFLRLFLLKYASLLLLSSLLTVLLSALFVNLTHPPSDGCIIFLLLIHYSTILP